MGWGWLQLSTDGTQGGGIRLKYPDAAFTTAVEARADLQRHLDRGADEPHFAKAAAAWRDASPTAKAVRSLPYAWTLYEIPRGSTPAAAANTTAREQARHLLDQPSAAGRTRSSRPWQAGPRFPLVLFVLGLLFLGGCGLKLVADGLTDHREPTCDGKAMRPWDVCVTTRAGRSGSSQYTETYQEKADALAHSTDFSVPLGVALLVLCVALLLWRHSRTKRRAQWAKEQEN
ncbi:hypothetical protein GCM10010218_27510 [Streptomyces mashuensis]|uniref:Uncharacterized protein n=1 Tax=Streptomyces mashuensis TaxID=33904 RepID=A0A919ECY0_9ACTN|nr:hypothetical protein [Streptomyces mashuensis]GHF44588.1 hypothetical protein GCM10010218_27510 [Streptomyces mashuensis]